LIHYDGKKKNSHDWVKVDDIQEKQEIWPEEEFFIVDQERIQNETEEQKLIGVLNILKDETRTKDVVKRMKKITKKLRQAMKDGKIKQEGGCDFLDEMFVEEKRGDHVIQGGQGGGRSYSIFVNTEIFCGGKRPSIQEMLEWVGSQNGNQLRPGVIFADVPRKYYKDQGMAGPKGNARWIMSSEGDCLFAFKKGNTMWLKAYPTTHGYSKGGPTILLSKEMFHTGYQGNMKRSLHKAVFATFTKAEWFFEDGNYSVDHINRDRNDARFVNLRAVTTKENNRNRRFCCNK
jgi:hypothetical protein